jgi:very-short-patch-repair endonuclease
MPAISSTPPGSGTQNAAISEELARLAARQHGVLSRLQLLEAGVAKGAITYRVDTGRLYRIHRGVYAVGYYSSSPMTRAMAAVLACGPGAVLSHGSAAALWDIGLSWPGCVEVTAAAARHHRGVTVHRSRTLTPQQTTVHLGIPVTTVARTLIDLADILDDRALARAFNEAQITRRMRAGELATFLPNLRGRRAATRLRPFIQRPASPTRSVLEDTFLALVESHALPRPQVNQRVAGYEVDMLWREQHLVAELDGRRYHEHDRAFERDRERDANLLAAGYRVIRVTWQRLASQPEREAERLRALLGR